LINLGIVLEGDIEKILSIEMKLKQKKEIEILVT